MRLTPSVLLFPSALFALLALAGSALAQNPMTSYCSPGVAGVLPCPCSNPPSSAGRGCDNSSATGGAVLSASGTAALLGDTVVFTTSGEKPTATSIVLQASGSNAAGSVFGQGVSCLSGTLQRLYVKAAVGGSIIAPAGSDPSVSARSAALGDPISPGQSRRYAVYYRDPVVLGACSANSTFNITQSGSIGWYSSNTGPIPTLKPISAGTFQMGSNAAAGAPYYGESSTQPVHQVTISYNFWMGEKEVTQAQYQALMGTNPSYFPGANNPVETVTWNDAVTYCAALTTQQAALGNVPAGYQYRLPTAAEWEYACRAGTTTEFNTGAALFCNDAKFDFSLHSNSSCNSSSTVPVGSYAPNAWGLYDMHGNVWEWCLDSYAPYTAGAVTDPFVTGGPTRVIRGGSWGNFSYACRSAIRGIYNPGLAYAYYGFRVVLAPVLVP
jgi:formylglycine-generating enzyme required for sulfatase activity